VITREGKSRTPALPPRKGTGGETEPQGDGGVMEEVRIQLPWLRDNLNIQGKGN
jgi:hypothetical protein